MPRIHRLSLGIGNTVLHLGSSAKKPTGRADIEVEDIQHVLLGARSAVFDARRAKIEDEVCGGLADGTYGFSCSQPSNFLQLCCFSVHTTKRTWDFELPSREEVRRPCLHRNHFVSPKFPPPPGLCVGVGFEEFDHQGPAPWTVFLQVHLKCLLPLPLLLLTA